MDSELGHSEEFTPLPEHIIYPEYTPEYPDVAFFKESFVTSREENIFCGELPPEEQNVIDLREERKKKRSRYLWLSRFLGSALRAGAALFALFFLISYAVRGRETEPGSAAETLKVLEADLHQDAFTPPQDYSASELAALWRGEPTAPHHYDYSRVIVLKEATCQEKGESAYQCDECGVLLKHLTTKDHTPAAEVRENIIDPDCVNTGSYEAVVTCSVCGEELSRKTVVTEALGHTEGEPVIENVVVPGCSAAGSCEEVRFCSACGEELSRTVKVLAATGHLEDTPHVENLIPSGCTEPGSYENVITCSVCGEEISRAKTVTAPTGHTEGEPVAEVIQAATCTEDGINAEVVRCAVCGEELSRTTTVSVATGHSYTEKVVKPTCTEQGYTEHTCSNCGDSYKDTYTAAAGHSYTEKVVKPTCTEKGYTSHTCSRCGNSYKDSEVAALGHNFPIGRNGRATCSRCGLEGLTFSYNARSGSFSFSVNSAYAKALKNAGYDQGEAYVVDAAGWLGESARWTGGTSGTIPHAELDNGRYSCHLVLMYWDDSQEYEATSRNKTITVR